MRVPLKQPLFPSWSGSLIHVCGTSGCSSSGKIHTHIPTHKQHSVWEKTHTLLSSVRSGETNTAVPPPLLSKPSPFLSSTLPNETHVEPQAKRDHYNMTERFCAILLFEQAELKSFMPYMVSYCKNITVNTQKHTVL